MLAKAGKASCAGEKSLAFLYLECLPRLKKQKMRLLFFVPQPLCGQFAVFKATNLTAAAPDQGAAFIFVGEVPADIADPILLQEGHPSVAFRFIDVAIAGSIGNAEFADKHGQAFFDGGLYFITVRFPMCSCVKMEGVHQVLITFDGTLRGSIYILRPVGGADQDEVVFIIRTDCLYHRRGIASYLFPAYVSIWFVADFVDNILVIPVFFGHLRKEFDRCLLV